VVAFGNWQRGGDNVTPQELTRLLDQHGPALVLYARQWCAAPEDVVQETIIQLVSQRRPPEDVVPWLFKVVRNRAISTARSTRRRRQRESQYAASEAWFEALDQRLDAMAAAAALEELPLEVREVLVARLWGDLSFEEIGRVTGTSTTTAHRRYQQGLAQLRERLESPCKKT